MKTLDPIVEEMRNNGEHFVARHDNDIARVCKALAAKQREQDRPLVDRPPKHCDQRKAG